MSVIERERAELPEVLTEREERARTLEAAALEIEWRGWTKCAYINSYGNVCVVGAIGCASGVIPKIYEFGGDVYHAAHIAWGDSPIPLIYFNDCDARGAEEVTFLLRWRAEEIRDGW